MRCHLSPRSDHERVEVSDDLTYLCLGEAHFLLHVRRRPEHVEPFLGQVVGDENPKPGPLPVTDYGFEGPGEHAGGGPRAVLDPAAAWQAVIAGPSCTCPRACVRFPHYNPALTSSPQSPSCCGRKQIAFVVQELVRAVRPLKRVVSFAL
eukprot:GHVU01015874.1.p1 GENE.GHVU01015874.1~~GHVU01015874.1.p1  ORF type:complete len:150 (-),score=1.58 GHVU01015874.1:190-639(-)